MFGIFGKRSSKKEEKSSQTGKRKTRNKIEKPQSESKNEAEKLFDKGNDLLNLGKPEQAIKCYDEAIRINPEYADTWKNKGVVLSLLGKSKEALKCVEKPIKLNSNIPGVHQLEQIILKKLGRG